jgi:hypothetical protein
MQQFVRLNRSYPERFPKFWILWIVASVTGCTIAVGFANQLNIVLMIRGILPPHWLARYAEMVLLGTMVGFVMALPQALLLTRFGRDCLLWPFITACSLASAGFVGSLAYESRDCCRVYFAHPTWPGWYPELLLSLKPWAASPAYIVTAAVVGGMVGGLLQHLTCRSKPLRSIWWFVTAPVAYYGFLVLPYPALQSHVLLGPIAAGAVLGGIGGLPLVRRGSPRA